MLRARISDGRAMEVLRIDATSRQPTLISRSEVSFDARSRPWYQSAIANDGVAWYAPYRYMINDAQGAYAAIGMGISAPVRSRDGQLIGVVTADVALSQLNDFLAALASESGAGPFWPRRRVNCWQCPRTIRLRVCLLWSKGSGCASTKAVTQ